MLVARARRSLTRAHASVGGRFSTAAASPPAGQTAGRVVFIGLTALTTGLGVWQLARYNWKLGVIADSRGALESEELDITAGASTDAAVEARPGTLTRVHVSGEFLPGPPVRVSPRTPPPRPACLPVLPLAGPQRLHRCAASAKGRRLHSARTEGLVARGCALTAPSLRPSDCARRGAGGGSGWSVLSPGCECSERWAGCAVAVGCGGAGGGCGPASWSLPSSPNRVRASLAHTRGGWTRHPTLAGHTAVGGPWGRLNPRPATLHTPLLRRNVVLSRSLWCGDHAPPLWGRGRERQVEAEVGTLGSSPSTSSADAVYASKDRDDERGAAALPTTGG